MTQKRININPLTGIIGAILFFALLYFIIKGAFFILGILTPALLIGAALLDWKVFPDYGMWIWKLLKSNPIAGIAAGVLSVVAMPFCAGFLFAKALFKNRIKKMGLNIPGMEDLNPNREEEFVDFEIVEDMPEEKLELPSMEKPKQDNSDTGEYEQLFD